MGRWSSRAWPNECPHGPTAVALIGFSPALVTVAWTNSHSMTVQAVLIARLTADVEQLERRLETCP